MAPASQRREEDRSNRSVRSGDLVKRALLEPGVAFVAMRQNGLTDTGPCRIDTPGAWMSVIIVAGLISLFREPNRAVFVDF